MVRGSHKHGCNYHGDEKGPVPWLLSWGPISYWTHKFWQYCGLCSIRYDKDGSQTPAYSENAAQCVPPGWLLWHSDCTKFNFCHGSALDPAGKAYNAPLNPVVSYRGGHPLPFPGLLHLWVEPNLHLQTLSPALQKHYHQSSPSLSQSVHPSFPETSNINNAMWIP